MSSGYYKSKEVYKYTETSNGKKLVPIRGLYVSGLHTEPLYMDHLISVSNFTSNHATIVDYTESTYNPNDQVLSIVGFNTLPSIDIQTYTSSKHDLSSDQVLSVVGFNTLPSIDILSYTLSKHDLPSDQVLSVVGFNTLPLDVVEFPTLRKNTTPEHLITIVDFDSTDTTITDINE